MTKKSTKEEYEKKVSELREVFCESISLRVKHVTVGFY